MKHVPAAEVETVDIVMDGADGVKLRWLVGESDGAPNFYLRRFEVAPGGYTPRHSHDWEHEVYILSGSGSVLREGEYRPVKPGDVLFIPAGEEHQFKADGNRELVFLCIIPRHGK